MAEGRGGYYREGKILVWDRYSHCSRRRKSDLASLHMIIIALSPKKWKRTETNNLPAFSTFICLIVTKASSMTKD